MRKALRTHVGDLDVGAVACGLGRAIGNKVRLLNKSTFHYRYYKNVHCEFGAIRLNVQECCCAITIIVPFI